MMQKKMLFVVILLVSVMRAEAQLPVIEIIKQASVKVIKAVDLMVQRWQNETIWLQNAQQTLENILHETQLKEIGEWAERQRALYADYFDELSQVKDFIAQYHRVKMIISTQAKIVREYRSAITLFRGDAHFTVAEIDYMEQVYAGILAESVQNVDRMQLVIKALTTKMTDAERLAIIDETADQVQQNYNDLQAFNNQNKLMSLQRAKTIDEARQVKAMYGLE
jgi:hypothetical protein